jgi:hypothetical protein
VKVMIFYLIGGSQLLGRESFSDIGGVDDNLFPDMCDPCDVDGARRGEPAHVL